MITLIDSRRRGQNQGQEGAEAGHPGVHRDADRPDCGHLHHAPQDLGREELRTPAPARANLQVGGVQVYSYETRF